MGFYKVIRNPTFTLAGKEEKEGSYQERYHLLRFNCARQEPTAVRNPQTREQRRTTLCAFFFRRFNRENSPPTQRQTDHQFPKGQRVTHTTRGGTIARAVL
jgi:hypothetical protein